MPDSRPPDQKKRGFDFRDVVFVVSLLIIAATIAAGIIISLPGG